MASSDPPAYTNTTSPPCYTNSFDEAAHVLLKPELADPTTQWPSRQWYRVTLQLQGTQILLQRNPGLLLCNRPLSLQGAQAGLATDYCKKRFVFRMRVEGYQFLCAAGSFAAAINWVDVLNAAIAVSVDLDERKEPNYQTIASSRIPSTRSLGVEMNGFLRVRQMWSQRKSSLNGAWLRGQVGEQNRMGLQRYLEDEERVLINGPVAMQQRCTPHCFCSSCFQDAQPRGSLDSSDFTSTRMESTSENAVAFDAKATPIGAAWQVDRLGLAWRRLEYARRCAKTLTFRASWVNHRYLRGRTWIDMEAETTTPITALPRRPWLI